MPLSYELSTSYSTHTSHRSSPTICMHRIMAFHHSPSLRTSTRPFTLRTRLNSVGSTPGRGSGHFFLFSGGGTSGAAGVGAGAWAAGAVTEAAAGACTLSARDDDDDDDACATGTGAWAGAKEAGAAACAAAAGAGGNEVSFGADPTTKVNLTCLVLTTSRPSGQLSSGS